MKIMFPLQFVIKNLHHTWFLCLVVLGFGLQGCSTSGTQTGDAAIAEYEKTPITESIPSDATTGTVSDAIETTFRGRKWEIKTISPEKAVGHLNHRNFDLTVTMVSDGSKIIFLNDSTYTDSHSELPRPGVPMGWLLDLQQDLVKNLSN